MKQFLSMKKVELIFPDTTTMASFILEYNVSKAEVNSLLCSLVAIMTEEKIVVACTTYRAILKNAVAR